jgi:hypothetical protein
LAKICYGGESIVNEIDDIKKEIEKLEYVKLYTKPCSEEMDKIEKKLKDVKQKLVDMILDSK